MNKVATELYMVFDVESVGLHGEGFSVGWYVIDGGGKRVASAQYACDPDRAEGSDEDRKWVAENIPVPRQGYNCSAPRFVRDEFWRAWMYAKQRGAVLAADVPWPVEARFLAQCIDDDQSRKWDGPYPIIDIASVRFAAGLDPLEAVTRNSDELPQHDPLCDSRQSARLLTELLSHRTAPAPGDEEVGYVQRLCNSIRHEARPCTPKLIDDLYLLGQRAGRVDDLCQQLREAREAFEMAGKESADLIKIMKAEIKMLKERESAAAESLRLERSVTDQQHQSQIATLTAERDEARREVERVSNSLMVSKLFIDGVSKHLECGATLENSGSWSSYCETVANNYMLRMTEACEIRDSLTAELASLKSGRVVETDGVNGLNSEKGVGC